MTIQLVAGLSRETLTTALRAITQGLETLANGAAIDCYKSAAGEIRAYSANLQAAESQAGHSFAVALPERREASFYADGHYSGADLAAIWNAALMASAAELERATRYMEINATSAQGKHLEGQRYRDERDAAELRNSELTDLLSKSGELFGAVEDELGAISASAVGVMRIKIAAALEPKPEGEIQSEYLQSCAAAERALAIKSLRTNADAGEVERLRAELAELRKWEQLIRENSPLVQRMEAAEQERDILRAQLAVPAETGRLINSQDNRGTDQPLFAVMEKRGMVTLDTHDHDRIEWYHSDSGTTADERTIQRLEKIQASGREVKGWERYAVKDIDVFVTACFTEQGCKDFLARDGHNHTKPYIYAFGSYRNGEYQSLRNWLKSLPASANPKTDGVLKDGE
ncbi:hypothetical protein [Pseudomonas sp. TWP3-2]|uniref:hypothetical protein n=1 Tax=Pseudomonas sp. TWP3-2 TaxID=2804574 RepID=UPI003CFB3B28